ncbi:MAG TPA: hypothetical protein VGC23_01590 [Vicinamibacterales bacterium]
MKKFRLPETFEKGSRSYFGGAARSAVVVLAAMLNGAPGAEPRETAAVALDRHAATYMDLVADLGALDPESVDVWITPAKAQDRRTAPTLIRISEVSRALASKVRNAEGAGEDAPRARTLAMQLDALALRSDQRAGARVLFADELRRLFGLELSDVSLSADSGGAARDALARRLPGTGALSRRLSQYQRRFVIPRGRLHAVITRSIAACRDQTTRFLALPSGEKLALEYVADVPWSGYSVYRGNYKSVMQVNRTLPLSIGQALNLACHEGYPGHHTYNILRDQHLVRQQHMREAISGLIFSPEGFRAEALAAAGAAIAFSTAEQIQLYRDHLFPLAGFNPDEAEMYAEVCNLVDRLSGSTTIAVRGYLSGEMNAADAVSALERNALMERPDGLVTYLDRYRGYTLAYTWGRDRLVSNLNEPALSVEGRWMLLRQFMTSPQGQEDLFAAR